CSSFTSLWAVRRLVWAWKSAAMWVGVSLISFLRGERKKQNKFHQISTNQPIKRAKFHIPICCQFARNCLPCGFFTLAANVWR
ncbi:MAG: hypothetical protein CVU08_16060, partial [Bacteroidetes bacterium HGW-Bacteroidetes-3]